MTFEWLTYLLLAVTIAGSYFLPAEGTPGYVVEAFLIVLLTITAYNYGYYEGCSTWKDDRAADNSH